MQNHAALRERSLHKLSSESLGTFLKTKWKSPKPQRKTWNKTPLNAATEPPPLARARKQGGPYGQHADHMGFVSKTFKQVKTRFVSF